jgi:hypothetical protein
MEKEKSDCEKGIHTYPDADFEVGPRTCDLCGHKEY